MHGLPNTAPDGFKIPFSAGHTRRMPRLTGGPFRYERPADRYLDVALRYARVPVKQAVISPSALSLMYPAERTSRLLARPSSLTTCCASTRPRSGAVCEKGAHKVQIDFTEGRLAVKIDPSGQVANSFIDLNNLALSRFTADERKRIGVHTCPAAIAIPPTARTSTTPSCCPACSSCRRAISTSSLAGEPDRVRVLKIIQKHIKTGSTCFRRRCFPDRSTHRVSRRDSDQVLEAAEYIPVEQLARRTIAASRLSATTHRRPATRRLPRSGHVCSEPPSR